MSLFLQDLDLSNNQLTQIPNEVGELRRLERLNVTGNKLTSLPRLEWCAQLKVCIVFWLYFAFDNTAVVQNIEVQLFLHYT